MIKAGILGGGQLGRMLLQTAANYPVETYILESDPNCPAAKLCHQFVLGNINDYHDVLNFGRGLDVITIEIESVNIEALEQLEKEGICIIPSPAAIRTIRNKVSQKLFYSENHIPTSPFVITNKREELKHHPGFIPGVHKIGMGGYDGRGIQVIETDANISMGFDVPAVFEKKVNIKKEISIIVAVGTDGKMAVYPPVDMIFDPHLNLLSYQICPAGISKNISQKAEAIAIKVVKELKSAGLFAVELFISDNDQIFVNETAPRVHNSGHHTIEAAYCSQFDMMWRILLRYPLGNPQLILPAAIVNLVGETNASGLANYEGLEQVLAIENVFVHIYGKKETRPGRKMGHVTILAENETILLHLANKVRHTLFVRAK